MLQIILDDCVKVLHESIQEGRLYDYVINDLTEFPVEKAIHGNYRKAMSAASNTQPFTKNVNSKQIS